MRRKGAADLDSLRIVDVVASFQLDCLVVVSVAAPYTRPYPEAVAVAAYPCTFAGDSTHETLPYCTPPQHHPDTAECM